jgi:hypothetical protein
VLAYGTSGSRKFVVLRTHRHTERALLIHTKPPQIFPRALFLRSYDRKTPWFCFVPTKHWGFKSESLRNRMNLGLPRPLHHPSSKHLSTTWRIAMHCLNLQPGNTHAAMNGARHQVPLLRTIFGKKRGPVAKTQRKI